MPISSIVSLTNKSQYISYKEDMHHDTSQITIFLKEQFTLKLELLFAETLVLYCISRIIFLLWALNRYQLCL